MPSDLRVVRPHAPPPSTRAHLVSLLKSSLLVLEDLKDAEPGAFYRAGLRSQIRTALALEQEPETPAHVLLEIERRPCHWTDFPDWYPRCSCGFVGHGWMFRDNAADEFERHARGVL